MTDPLHDDLHDNPTQTGDETGAGRPAEELTSSLLAYGDEPETEPETEPGQTMPKRRVVAWAAGILAAGCAIAGGIVVWDATHHPTARSHPAATTTAAAAPTTAVAPPLTVTVQAPTPQTTVAPTPGPSAYDQNFLSLMRQEGWGCTDNSDAEQCGKEMISFAHQVCSYAGLGYLGRLPEYGRVFVHQPGTRRAARRCEREPGLPKLHIHRRIAAPCGTTPCGTDTDTGAVLLLA